MTMVGSILTTGAGGVASDPPRDLHLFTRAMEDGNAVIATLNLAKTNRERSQRRAI